jgi:hypothetical protein
VTSGDGLHGVYIGIETVDGDTVKVWRVDTTGVVNCNKYCCR